MAISDSVAAADPVPLSAALAALPQWGGGQDDVVGHAGQQYGQQQYGGEDQQQRGHIGAFETSGGTSPTRLPGTPPSTLTAS
jgi:hypothetical protein